MKKFERIIVTVCFIVAAILAIVIGVRASSSEKENDKLSNVVKGLEKENSELKSKNAALTTINKKYRNLLEDSCNELGDDNDAANDNYTVSNWRESEFWHELENDPPLLASLISYVDLTTGSSYLEMFTKEATTTDDPSTPLEVAIQTFADNSYMRETGVSLVKYFASIGISTVPVDSQSVRVSMSRLSYDPGRDCYYPTPPNPTPEPYDGPQ